MKKLYSASVALLGLFAVQAQAAVPAAVTTAITDGTADGTTIGYALLSFAVVVGVIMYIKRKAG